VPFDHVAERARALCELRVLGAPDDERHVLADLDAGRALLARPHRFFDLGRLAATAASPARGHHHEA
jgi:hypothetical protein